MKIKIIVATSIIVKITIVLLCFTTLLLCPSTFFTTIFAFNLRSPILLSILFNLCDKLSNLSLSIILSSALYALNAKVTFALLLYFLLLI